MPVVYSEFGIKMGDSGQFSVVLETDMLTRATNKHQAVLGNRCSFRYDALSVFDQNRRADGYSQKQRKCSIKRAAKSEWDKFSKQRPKLVEFRCKQHGHIGKYRTTNRFSFGEQILPDYKHQTPMVI